MQVRMFFNPLTAILYISMDIIFSLHYVAYYGYKL